MATRNKKQILHNKKANINRKRRSTKHTQHRGVFFTQTNWFPSLRTRCVHLFRTLCRAPSHGNAVPLKHWDQGARQRNYRVRVGVNRQTHTYNKRTMENICKQRHRSVHTVISQGINLRSVFIISS